ncbi:hypothetical protein [Methanosarcina horonobensis]|nr:hypothetical protein [Methanosarcina horonobensis]
METSGEIEIEKVDFLSFAARNLRHIGTNRNRGFGLVSCSLSGEQVPEYDESIVKLRKLVEV